MTKVESTCENKKEGAGKRLIIYMGFITSSLEIFRLVTITVCWNVTPCDLVESEPMHQTKLLFHLLAILQYVRTFPVV